MPKIFAVSDIHSFYTPLIEALESAGYDQNNPDHLLIVCGDIFDRGDESFKVLKFLKSIPRERRILIRGNHEYLLRDAINREKFYDHDYHNGTVKTITDLTGYDYYDSFICPEFICEDFKGHKILEWIFSDEWQDYYETDNFIFVHSWIPLIAKDNLPAQYIRNRVFEYREDWRNATDVEWEDATWGCPWMMSKQGMNQTGKTIVCGHWHCSDFHDNLPDDPIGIDGVDPRSENEIYFSKDVVALDGCTAMTGFCNVLVIEGDKCYDQHKHPLPFRDFQEPDISLKNEE